jgi:hypothetical protein
MNIVKHDSKVSGKTHSFFLLALFVEWGEVEYHSPTLTGWYTGPGV